MSRPDGAMDRVYDVEWMRRVHEGMMSDGIRWHLTTLQHSSYMHTYVFDARCGRILLATTCYPSSHNLDSFFPSKDKRYTHFGQVA